MHLAEEFDDYKHRGLYIKLAKTHPRALLEKAYSFVIDSNAKNKGALFMWKLKELRSNAEGLGIKDKDKDEGLTNKDKVEPEDKG